MDELANQPGTDPDTVSDLPLPSFTSREADDALAGLKGINEVAAALGITHRTLRFYEDKGLIEPARVGNTRIYSRRDVARMQLILRGKRLGFSIREIKDFLDLYDADPSQLEQMQHLLAQVRTRLRQLERQRAALQMTIAELKTMELQARERIAELTRKD
ncbi:MerR family transcriptional regulator [Novosphingobium nitrogenifigens DSM 19370]|uniref:MerR family transcriptional regulator n=1 Tax=Novosphingobium nitrogenifigens DSM 19370 TaxID=983920 RepID=F1ZAH6_9SPHN|nr:MerR family DNA-binding transcriptional regulator [Novosphingobium nitrogenifigens]EGD58416.1 MerR family transcriptional regulator [Novosphingobium nitrogenifigens DSM 19370]